MNEQKSADALLERLETCTPLIPPDLTQFHLARAGFHTPHPSLTKLVSVSAHKFLAEVTNDALQYAKMRLASAAKGKADKNKKLVLTNEDLAAALKEYGFNVKKPEYFVDGPLAPEGRGRGTSGPAEAERECQAPDGSGFGGL